MKYWLFLALPGLVLTFFEKNYRIKRLYIFLALLSITHFVVISFGSTKLHWYGLPEYPFWSIMAAISFYQIISGVSKLIKSKIITNIIATILIAAVLLFPILDTIERVKHYEDEFIPANTKMFLRDEIRGFINQDDKVSVFTTMYAQNLVFYIRLLQMDGYNISLGKFKNISENDIVLLDEYEIPKSLVTSVNALFVTETIREYHKTVVLSKIVRKRSYEEAVDYALQQLGNNSEDAESNKIKAESMVTDAMSVLGYKK